MRNGHACLARLDHSVIGVDSDQHKVDNVRDGLAPFYEPGLEEIVRTTVASGRFSATASASEALEDADVALLCVGTPSGGRMGTSALISFCRVVKDISSCLKGRSKPLIVAIRSTVFPGTCEEIVAPAFTGHPASYALCRIPEFLREGCAVRDFMEPAAGGRRLRCRRRSVVWRTSMIRSRSSLAW